MLFNYEYTWDIAEAGYPGCSTSWDLMWHWLDKDPPAVILKDDIGMFTLWAVESGYPLKGRAWTFIIDFGWYSAAHAEVSDQRTIVDVENIYQEEVRHNIMMPLKANECLIEQTCAPCRGGMPSLSHEEAEIYINQVPGWTFSDDRTWIHRDFKFKTFMDAFTFLGKVAAVSEKEGHHPDYHGGWGKLSLFLTTHAAKGLTKNDFILAAKINQL